MRADVLILMTHSHELLRHEREHALRARPVPGEEEEVVFLPFRRVIVPGDGRQLVEGEVAGEDEFVAGADVGALLEVVGFERSGDGGRGEGTGVVVLGGVYGRAEVVVLLGARGGLMLLVGARSWLLGMLLGWAMLAVGFGRLLKDRLLKCRLLKSALLKIWLLGGGLLNVGLLYCYRRRWLLRVAFDLAILLGIVLIRSVIVAAPPIRNCSSDNIAALGQHLLYQSRASCRSTCCNKARNLDSLRNFPLFLNGWSDHLDCRLRRNPQAILWVDQLLR